MKLFSTAFSFTHWKNALEGLEAWASLLPNKRIAILDLTRLCCERGRPPESIRILANTAMWTFDKNMGCMRLWPDGRLMLTVYRRTRGGGRMGETFWASVRLKYDIIGFFNKIDRIKREAP